ncbi:MAG: cell division protein FtsL [Pseudomonadota bacterium]
MTRVSIVLLIILVTCALGLITAQHKARKLFNDLQKEQDLEKQLGVEWGQLQLEQSTWATRSRVEKIATRNLGMRVPETNKIRVITLGAEPPSSSSDTAPAESATWAQ